jgi:hypothetical protein
LSHPTGLYSQPAGLSSPVGTASNLADACGNVLSAALTTPICRRRIRPTARAAAMPDGGFACAGKRGLVI